MQRILIVAYGNPLRSDDGVAWRAAEQLSSKFRSGEVEIQRLHQLAPELADTVRAFRRVIFIDAASSEGVAGIPGTIRVEEVRTEARKASHSTHVFSPQRVLNLAAELYGVHPRAFLVTVIGASFDHGESLSREVTRALPELLSTIECLVHETLSDSSSLSRS